MTSSYPHVVKIYATTQSPDYDCPWQARTPSTSTGSGVVISGTEILTGAHVVANATFLRVQKSAHPNKGIARVKSICHDCDLALLEMEDTAFFEGIQPAELGELSELRDKVSVVGFPIGGEEISITEGVVSRIEVQQYSHSQCSFLAVTVDAAINRGNSGGPVFKGDKIAGIAFQKLSDADNIGEMVPTPLIRNFLKRARETKVVEMPAFGFVTQTLENPRLRKHIGLNDEESGVLITAVPYNNSSHGVLEEGDAILEVDGLPIANNGTVLFRNLYRTQFSVVLGEYALGDTIPLKILRGGERFTVNLVLKPKRYLVPRAKYDCLPTYFVYGGLVFQPLSRNLLVTWGDEWWNQAPADFIQCYYSGIPTKERQEVVLLTQILADQINVGYENLYNERIVSVNGQTIANMKDFVESLENAQDFIELKTSHEARIVLDVEAVQAANDRILKRYHIKSAYSTDLREKSA